MNERIIARNNGSFVVLVLDWWHLFCETIACLRNNYAILTSCRHTLFLYNTHCNGDTCVHVS